MVLMLTKQLLACQRLVEQSRHDFQRLGLIPKSLRRFKNRRMPKAGKQLLLVIAQPVMKAALAGGQMPLQKRQRKFYGDELVAFAALARGGQRALVLRIESGGERGQFERLPRGANVSSTGQVETNLQAAGMKCPGPIQRLRRGKIVPFDAVTGVLKAAVQLAPARAHWLPEIRFTEGRLRAIPCCSFAFAGRRTNHTRRLA